MNFDFKIVLADGEGSSNINNRRNHRLVSMLQQEKAKNIAIVHSLTQITAPQRPFHDLGQIIPIDATVAAETSFITTREYCRATLPRLMWGPRSHPSAAAVFAMMLALQARCLSPLALDALPVERQARRTAVQLPSRRVPLGLV